MFATEKDKENTRVITSKGFDCYDMRIGDIMRGERATLGKSLVDVQNELKIKASIIAAIENADISVFDVPAFVSGQVRSYARYLGMDPDEVFTKFCEEANFHPKGSLVKEPSKAKPMMDRAPNPQFVSFSGLNGRFSSRQETFFDRFGPGTLGSLVALIIVLALLAYGLWIFTYAVQRIDLAPIEDAPIVSSEVETYTPEVFSTQAELPELKENAQAPLLSSQPVTYNVQSQKPNALALRDVPIGMIDLQDTESAQVRVIEKAVDNIPETPQPISGVAPVHVPASVMTLFAVRPSWVRVTDTTGVILLERIMDAGDSWVVPVVSGGNTPILRTGNSGALYVSLDTQTYGPIAPGNKVEKNVVLSVDVLKARLPLANIAEDPQLEEVLNAGLSENF